MKDPSDRTKVVVRHLPPSISQAVLMEQIDGRFAGRYDWVCFRPGNNSQKNQRHSRVYFNFKSLEDVVEFAEFFDGHLFVNEKGAQFKALVEYAPSQRLPKLWSKKDGREGTISKDPEYMEFLELISKPVEHLPSAEIQLERKEAERAGSTKETLIVTPLMDFVRRKRAAKGGPQRITSSAKASRRASRVSTISSSSKRSSERRKVATSTYVLRDSTKKGSVKDKPTFILMSRREEQQSSRDKYVSIASLTGKEASEDAHASGAFESGKSKLVLLKGKEREGSDASRGLVQQQYVTSAVRSSPTSTSRHNQASGRIIRSILSKEGHVDQSYIAASHPDLHMQATNAEKERRPAWPPNASSNMKDYVSRSSSSLVPISDGEDKVAINNTHGFISNIERHEKRTRNKDRPDRGVWAPLRRSDRSHPSDVTPSSEASQMLTDYPMFISHKTGGKVGEDDVVIQNVRTGRGSNSHAAYDTSLGHGERKIDVSSASSHGGSRVNHFAVENGSHRHVGRRGSARGLKEVDNSMSLLEAKGAKRGSTGYSSHERQVWVQKSGSAP
ncbi:regulator of nonsense transcripts UPF3-like isoform X1 [Canna indica]|uniref:Regulator of nonsense transcripts UPF3-like isoform X1 n=1 Tax=Canna indica TaxID=4628 RepID=A0AAQ3K5I1_9LILI|nr:regulator of nonsense transcripts UPF3-like isoform X1 [Canna indica]